MEKDKKETKALENNEKTNSPEQGRQPGDAQQTATAPNTDISNVDQQEGEMNLGELGGNFDEPNNAGA